MSSNDFTEAVEAFRQALVPLLNGNAGPVTGMFSRREDVTLSATAED